MSGRTAAWTAADRRQGMQLGDLERFLTDCRALELPPEAVVVATVSMRGRLQRIEASHVGGGVGGSYGEVPGGPAPTG